MSGRLAVGRAQGAKGGRAATERFSARSVSVTHFFQKSRHRVFPDGYCSTVQGLLVWFEVDLGFPALVLFRLICVFCVFLFSTPSRFPLVLFGHPVQKGGEGRAAAERFRLLGLPSQSVQFCW